MIVDFANEVRDWIARNLIRGVQPQSVVQELTGNGLEQPLALAMVQAVSNALLFGEPMPQGKLDLATPPARYVPGPSRLGHASMLKAGTRSIPVLARLQRPSAALLGGVIDADECTQLIAQARPRMTASTVVDPITGLDRVADHRSSAGMFFSLMETPLVARIERRIAALTGLPIEHGEGLQILHYPTGAESTPHYDYLMPGNDANRSSIARSGQRIATFIMYLNDVDDGGETRFPHVGWSVLPRRGQALYFEYGNADRRTDPMSLHAGGTVLAGEKWIATKWIREREFVPAR
ncbi:2OG-Fe(II) oxygenase [Bordetella sp. N]|uniref:2OG-Fe(II) oxygenase n=1 Tax=Bordetella sp. N TaxID=1746199 RepID=UPI00071052A2|nr:2OG-Fe(II) oxygenase [Bordetella sp. N]ALM86072.1 proline dioxygenase [Bordetella sp. N]